MNRFQHLILAGLLAAGLLTAGDGSPKVIYINHQKVDETLQHTGFGNLITAPDFIVMGSHRGEAGKVEMHERETDIFYVTDGEATFVTGGKMVGGRLVKPGQWLGTNIIGGEVHHLSKGDVMMIRAGVPHWYKEVPHSVSYFVVKVLKP